MKQKLTGFEAEKLAELTPRQREVLALLQEGKVNKEIANQLNISLGTVKQHLVAAFKKLGVKNRTMAVGRLGELANQTDLSSIFSQETLLARRPALVLSLKLASGLPQAVNKLFHTCLAELAFDTQAQFLSPTEGKGDLIFGLKRSSNQDLRMAIRAAEHLYCTLNTFCTQEKLPTAQLLTGVVIAGLVKVSQNRYGGWSGETVGSKLLTQAHQLRDTATLGHLYFHPRVTQAMQAFALALPTNKTAEVEFAALPSLKSWNFAQDKPLVGRDKELAYLHQLLAENLKLLIVESENGVGKSRFAREAARLALQASWQVTYANILPSGYLDCDGYQGLVKITKFLADLTPSKSSKQLLVIDDAHHLYAEDKKLLVNFLNQLAPQTYVLLSGRQPQTYPLAPELAACTQLIRLARLTKEDSLKLLGQLSSKKQNKVAASARGVPLFINELALQGKAAKLPLAVIITIAARIDKFKMDWKLLYAIALHPAPVSLANLQEIMGDDLAYLEEALAEAEKLGILVTTNQQVAFKSPLVQEVIKYLFQPVK